MQTKLHVLLAYFFRVVWTAQYLIGSFLTCGGRPQVPLWTIFHAWADTWVESLMFASQLDRFLTYELTAPGCLEEPTAVRGK